MSLSPASSSNVGLLTAKTRGEKTKERVYPLLSRQEVEGLIANGRSVVIVDQYVLKVDGWLKYHPGGDKAIMHMVGRDATDEVTVFHSPEAKAHMSRYRIGRIEGRWKNFVPPIQGGAFRALPSEDESSGDSIGTPSAGDPSSREPSPVFDTRESTVRHRRQGDRTSHSASVSSASEDTEEEEMDGMTYLDSETRKQISLDIEKYPSLDSDTQDAIVQKYRLLHEKIKAEGLYKCNYGAYALEVSKYTLLAAGMVFFLRLGWYVPSAVFLGFFWHQLVFAAHDAGHMGITHKFHVDSVIAIIIADFLGGLSMGWWKRNHNVHHLVTNSPEHDPDIEHMPFFAVSHRLLSDLRSSYYDRLMAYDAFAKVFLRFQSYSYYPIMAFGRFNLYVLTWDHIIAGRGPRKGPAWWHRWLELVGQVFFWTWFGYGVLYKSIPTGWDRLVFVLISHMMQAPLHTQLTLSHFAMSTADLGPNESFPQKMLRTTMDVDCPPWLDFIHGGLQFQAIHHLYPRIPRHNLRRTQKLVQEFCNEVGIPYALYGFVDGNKEVIGRLAEVSRQAAILAKCQRAVAKNGDGHHH